MAKDFAKKFYKSKEWRECRESYIIKVHGLCERCMRPGKILHHKIKLSPENINNPDVVLNHDNLEFLCQTCHNADELKEHTENPIVLRYRFDESGDILPPSKNE